MYKKLTAKEKKLRNLRRSYHPETPEDLIKQWRMLSKRLKEFAKKQAADGKHKASEENKLMAEMLEASIQNLKDTLFLKASKSDWRP